MSRTEAEALIARYGDPGLASRAIPVGEWDDPIEACFERGWSDGLPIVPPTREAVEACLEWVMMPPDQLIGIEPVRGLAITAEKLAINAVMANHSRVCQTSLAALLSGQICCARCPCGWMALRTRLLPL